MTLISADTTPRHLRRQAACIPGTRISVFDLTRQQEDALDQLRDFLKLSQVTLSGFDLTDETERKMAVGIVTRAAALAITGNTEATVTRKWGMNRLPEDSARLRSFEHVLAHTADTMKHAVRTLGPDRTTQLLATVQTPHRPPSFT